MSLLLMISCAGEMSIHAFEAISLSNDYQKYRFLAKVEGEAEEAARKPARSFKFSVSSLLRRTHPVE